MRLSALTWQEDDAGRRRLFRYDEGGVFGQITYILNQPRNLNAETATAGSLYMLHRKDFLAMSRDHPALALAVHTALLKSVCLTLAQNHAVAAGNSI